MKRQSHELSSLVSNVSSLMNVFGFVLSLYLPPIYQVVYIWWLSLMLLFEEWLVGHFNKRLVLTETLTIQYKTEHMVHRHTTNSSAAAVVI